LDELYGDDEPEIEQAIKELSEDSRKELKMMKRAVIRGMYEVALPRHVREIRETGAEFVERTCVALVTATPILGCVHMSLSPYMRSWLPNMG
jgi:hypothetical protein